jgi:hypothetical protein
MPCRSTLSTPVRAALALLAAGLIPPSATATPRPLAESELSEVRGADGSILPGLQGGAASGSGNPFSSGLAAAFASSTGPAVLNASQFASQLAGMGLSLDMMPGYRGEPAAQTVVDAPPVTFSFNLSDVLRAGTGLAYNGGASMGTFTMTNFDARGTTIWVWQHH